MDAASLGLHPRAKELPSSTATASFWIRLVVGLLMAQGLYYALRQLCTAYVLATVDRPDQVAWWDSFPGLILTQAIQAVAYLHNCCRIAICNLKAWFECRRSRHE